MSDLSRSVASKKRGDGCGTRIGVPGRDGPCGEVGLCGRCWERAETRDKLLAAGRDAEDVEAILAVLKPPPVPPLARTGEHTPRGRSDA